MAEIVMPRLSDSMEEGTVLKWLKSVGDEVAVGDELVEIETDKANMVYEADAAGMLVEIVAPEGEVVSGASAGERGGSASASTAAPFPLGASPASPTRAITSPIGSVSPSLATTSTSVPAASAS